MEQEAGLNAVGDEVAAATLAPRGQCGAENSVCVIVRGCDVHGYWWCQEPASGTAGPHNNHNHRSSTTRHQWPSHTPSQSSPILIRDYHCRRRDDRHDHRPRATTASTKGHSQVRDRNTDACHWRHVLPALRGARCVTRGCAECCGVGDVHLPSPLLLLLLLLLRLHFRLLLFLLLLFPLLLRAARPWVWPPAKRVWWPCWPGNSPPTVAQRLVILEEPPGSPGGAGAVASASWKMSRTTSCEMQQRVVTSRVETFPVHLGNRTPPGDVANVNHLPSLPTLPALPTLPVLPALPGDAVRAPRRVTTRPDGSYAPQRSFSFRERSDSLGGVSSLRPQEPAAPTHHLSMDLEVPDAARQQSLVVNHSFPDLYDMTTQGKLPRTLSTSALRIKSRSIFWEKFWQGPMEPRMGSKL